MNFLDHPQPQPQEGKHQNVEDVFSGTEQHPTHPEELDSNAGADKVSLEAKHTTTGEAQEEEPFVYSSPVAPLGGESSVDEMWMAGKVSEASAHEVKENGHGTTDAVRKEIEMRTAKIDEESRKKAAKQAAAAETYMKEFIAKHDAKLKEKREEHMRQQKEDEAKRNQFKQTGAVWNGVGMMTDLNKTNAYSKSTERMRSILKKLDATSNLSVSAAE